MSDDVSFVKGDVGAFSGGGGGVDYHQTGQELSHVWVLLAAGPQRMCQP